MTGLLELYPEPGQLRQLHGLHLAHDIRSRTGTNGTYLYTGFITSIDGRISVGDTDGAPVAIRNDRDWRLFQELIAQADAVLVSGRYVRDLASGRAKSIFASASDPASADLVDYRRTLGLSDRPAAVVATRSGLIEPATARTLSETVYVAHGGGVAPDLIRSWEDLSLVPIDAGDGGVDAPTLLSRLAALGHHTIFSAAGPSILNLAAASIDALYLTVAGALVGGLDYTTIFEAEELNPPIHFDLASAYLDRGPDRFQLFLELTAKRDAAAAGGSSGVGD